MSLICLAFFARTVAVYAGPIESIALEASRRLPPAFALYAAGYVASAIAWVHILRILGGTVSIRAGTAILWTTQFGKYLPGNVGHHVGRVAVARRFGLGTGIVVKSMALEMGLVIALIIIFALPSAGVLLVRFDTRWLLVAAVLVIAASVLLGYRAIHRRDSATGGVTILRSGPTLVKTWFPVVVALAAAIALSGSSLFPLAVGPAISPLRILEMVSLFCVAWLAGFVVPGAPAGLGVRELILTQGLSSMIGHDQAVTAALLFRLLTVLADLTAFIAGLLLLKVCSDRSTACRPAPPAVGTRQPV